MVKDVTDIRPSPIVGIGTAVVLGNKMFSGLILNSEISTNNKPIKLCVVS